MEPIITIRRTRYDDPAFKSLTRELDADLRARYLTEHGINSIPSTKHLGRIGKSGAGLQRPRSAIGCGAAAPAAGRRKNHRTETHVRAGRFPCAGASAAAYWKNSNNGRRKPVIILSGWKRAINSPKPSASTPATATSPSLPMAFTGISTRPFAWKRNW